MNTETSTTAMQLVAQTGLQARQAIRAGLWAGHTSGMAPH